MICPNCGTNLADGTKACVMCGYWVAEEPPAGNSSDIAGDKKASNGGRQGEPINCPKCGNALPAGKSFCPMCGTKLDIAGSDKTGAATAVNEGVPHTNAGSKAAGTPGEQGESLNIATKSPGKSKKRAGIIGGLCAAGGVAAALIIIFAVTGHKQLSLEEQLESLEAKAQTASAEELKDIYKEAEEVGKKIEESAKASLEAELASQEAAKKAESEQSTSDSGAQTTTSQQTAAQPTSTTIGSSLQAQETSMAQTITPVEVYAEPASIISKSGNMVADGQYDKYTFTAPYDGRYRAEMTGLAAGSLVDLDFYGSGGTLLDSNYGIGNGDGVTVKDLVAGSTYEVVVSYNNGTTPYLLMVGLQKPALDISKATIAYDSVEYTDQRNLYNFTPAQTGDYRFELADVPGGVLLDVFAFDDPGNKLGSKEGVSNGDGLTLKNLKAGEVYEIQVRQSKGLGGYSLVVK